LQDLTCASLQADYELRRNLIISAKVAATWNKNQVINHYDRDFNANLAATRRRDRGLDLQSSYNRRETSLGGAAGLRFDDDLVSFAVTVQR
jgi:hypothetical protein